MDDPDNATNDGIQDILEQPKKRRKTLAQDALGESDSADVETQLKSLFDQMSDVTFDVTVQKYNPQTKSYPQIASYKDVEDVKEILSTDEIGKQYGGGKYKLIVRYEGESGKFEHWTKVFELDKAYDRFSQASVNPDKGQSYSNSNQMPIGDLLAMMSAQSERTMQMMMTMMQSSQNAMATMVAAMASAKPADANTELLKEIIKNSKTDPTAQMQAMVKTMQDLKALAEPKIEEEYEEDDEEEEEDELANPDMMSELGKAVVPAISGILGLNKQQPPQQQETGAA